MLARNFLVLMAVLFVGLSELNASGGDDTIWVTTVEGERARISSEEARRAFRETILAKNNHAEKIETNEDGSVVIFRPYFQFDGVKLNYFLSYRSAEEKQEKDSMQGICVRFGFKEYVEADSVSMEKIEKRVILNLSGGYARQETAFSCVNWIVCR